MTRRGVLLLLLLCAATPGFPGERYCPKGLVAYETHQPGSPYMCVKPQERALPAPDRACQSREEREKLKRKLAEAIERPSCEAAAEKVSAKPLDCYNLQSIRDFKTLLLARVTADDDEAEAIAKSLCPLTAPLACMNPEPQCRTRAALPNLTPWRRPWDEQDLADVAKYFRKLLPVSAKQADVLAERYKRKHPGFWTVDDVDD